MVTETGARGPARTTLKMKAKISSETFIIITTRHGVLSQKRFHKYLLERRASYLSNRSLCTFVDTKTRIAKKWLRKMWHWSVILKFIDALNPSLENYVCFWAHLERNSKRIYRIEDRFL